MTKTYTMELAGKTLRVDVGRVADQAKSTGETGGAGGDLRQDLPGNHEGIRQWQSRNFSGLRRESRETRRAA